MTPLDYLAMAARALEGASPGLRTLDGILGTLSDRCRELRDQVDRLLVAAAEAEADR